MKTSSAYIAPETLTVVIDDNNNKETVVIKTSLTHFKHKINPLIADPSFDIWSVNKNNKTYSKNHRQ